MARLGLARRRFFIDAVENRGAALGGERAHHLYHVLRVRPGQSFELSDGRRLYVGRVTAATAAQVAFAIEQELAVVLPCAQVALLAAIFKFDRMEWMIEKATELGVAAILPVIAARTETALAKAAGKRVERWRRIAWEAAQQSRRMAPPEIGQPCRFDAALRGAVGTRRLVLDEASDDGGRWLVDGGWTGGGTTTLLVGPEGGWTEGERTKAREAGFAPVWLGPLVLRAETAAIAALAVLNTAGGPAGMPVPTVRG